MSEHIDMQNAGRFPGGLRLIGHKEHTTTEPIGVIPVPARLVLPLNQHIGKPAVPVVDVGQRVLRGQKIAEAHGPLSMPVHASSSGVVRDIARLPVPHPGGMTGTCIVIETDGLDEPAPCPARADYQGLQPEKLIALIEDAGIVGLGGAVFPTAPKMRRGVDLKALIINGAECEPYISCDDRLMREKSAELIGGISIMLDALGIDQAVIGIEKDKPEASEALEAAMAERDDQRIELVKIFTIYPAGGERQIIQVLTGEEVPSGSLPQDIGYLCHNVGTAVAVHDAIIRGQPQISRIVTVAGKAVGKTGNFEVRLGTLLSDIVKACGGYDLSEGVGGLIMGGPMMGFSLASDEVPTVKASNCFIIARPDELRKTPFEMPCIRCGDCERVCPAELQPQDLFWQIQGGDLAGADRLHVVDCIECGCCDYVCPSHIPLAQHFRFAKAELRERQTESEYAGKQQKRFEQHEARIDGQQQQRQQRLDERKKNLMASRAESDNSGGSEA